MVVKQTVEVDEELLSSGGVAALALVLDPTDLDCIGRGMGENVSDNARQSLPPATRCCALWKHRLELARDETETGLIKN